MPGRPISISRRTALALAVLVSLAPMPGLVQASYPNRPVRLIAPFPPGGASEVVNRINAALAKVMQMPDVRETYAKLGVATQHSTPAKVSETIRDESPLMARILKSAGVEAE